ncbi:PKD domain-containing protein [Aggregatimonas sangjinii]|uniref:PKD domain-containing protein n=1 Tax=Aggregatimonas sangjinii TaxID=2583587 RepID=A0A5B7SSP3_9FLAO|nr:Ig-like domain-containing protein [Aggregatimonas sangjinii]QCX00033.1 PKD domain-containing protein [Aggregatimonas sangjinii]
MKKSLDRAVSLCCLFLVALACTKDVGLITEVEFEILEEHTSEGFVNQGLPTTFTIVPEAILENYEYTISYEILQGNGYFEDVEGNRLEAGKGQPIESPFTTSLLYMGTEVGEHRVKIVGSDNFGISEEIEITYDLENVPALWEASSELTEIELGKAADIFLLFEPVDTALEVTYEARLEFASGSGTLAPIQEEGYPLDGDYAAIAPGTYPFMFTPSELGTQELVFVLRDSNGQELRETLSFNVVEVIRVISIFLGEDDTIELQLGDEVAPDITFDPPNASDQGFILVSDNPDVVLIDENNICIAVGLGTAIVTVTSLSNPEATDTVTVTVVEPDRVPVSAITIAQEDPDAQGAVRQLIATILPADATDTSVTWSSSDDTVATIDANGLLTGLAAGTVTITATSVSDPGVVDTIEVNISGGSLQDGNDITAFALPIQNSSTIDAENHTVTVNVAEGTYLEGTSASIEVSPGATIDPLPTALRNFVTPTPYTVTAGNGEQQVWVVNVTVSPPVGSASNDITEFSIAGQVAPFAIDATEHTISVTVPNGTPLNVAPQALVISESATIDPAIDEVRDFAGPVLYTVTAENGTEQVWTVNTTVLPITGTGANDITAFALPAQSGQAVIDNTANTITVTVPDGTSLNVAPITLEISLNSTVAPAIGIVQDFSAAVIYTVTADDGTSKEWTVNTTVAANQGPVANDDTATVELSGSVSIPVLANDTDAETPNEELEISAIIGVQPEDAGSFEQQGREFVFTSSGAYVGEASFGYTITDVNPGNEASATVTVNIVQTEILVSEIVLAPTELTLDINETGQLTATVTPDNATNSNVDWISSDTTVATVNAAGEVTGTGEGEAVITASSNDSGDVSAAANVTVSAPRSGANAITAFTLPNQSGQAEINGSTNTITVTVPDGTELNVAPATLAISPNAGITPAIDAVLDFSEAIEYTVTAEDGTSRLWTVNVSVSANQAPVAVDDTIGVEVGETRIINVLDNDSDVDTPNSELRVIAIGTLTPAGFGSAQILNDRSIEFISNGPTTEEEIVTFTYTIDDGNPGNESTATITVNLTFNEVLVTGITLNPTELTLDIDESAQLVATVTPDNATNSSIDWSSSDETIATVSAIGEVTGRSEGTATITASSNDASNVVETAEIIVELAASNANDITAFSIPGQTVPSVINTTAHTVVVEVPFGTNLNVSPSNFVISPSATVDPVGSSQQDFSVPVEYTVTAENTDVQVWEVTVNVDADTRSGANDITAFSIPGQTVPSVINTTAHTVVVEVPFGTNLNVSPSNFVISPSATVDPVGSSQQDFSVPVEYTVTAENTDVQVWEVTVNVDADTRSGANDITAFSIPGQTVPSVINATAHTVVVEVPFGTNLNVSPSNFVISPSATVDPVGSSQQDFSVPVEYTVTAENTDVQVWEVTVNVDADTRSGANDITAFSIPGQTVPSVINTTAHTVVVEVPFGTNLNVSPSNFVISPSATVDPVGSSQQDFSVPVEYTVTAENTDVQVWEVTVNVDADTRSGANDITAFSIPGQTVPSVINATAHTVVVEVPFGTNLNVSPLAFSVSSDATVDPSGSSQQDFSVPVEYTVTAENTDVQVWEVTVNVDADTRSGANDITAFSIPGQTVPSVINATAHTVVVEVPFGTNLNVSPSNFVISPSATVDPVGSSQQDFSVPVEYTVTAENTDVQIWEVNVNVQNGDPDAVITPGLFNIQTLTGSYSGADSTDPENDPLTYQWNFGDPDSGVDNVFFGVNPTHTFSRPGEYTITLTVFDDNNGSDNTSLIVVVEEPQTPEFTFSIDPIPNEVSGPVNVRFRIEPNQAAIDLGVQFEMSFASAGGGIPLGALFLDYNGNQYGAGDIFDANYVISNGLLEGLFTNCEFYSLRFTVTTNISGLESQFRIIDFQFKDGSACP